MESIQASEAETNFLRLLDRVEAGESVVITRHGRAVARLSPEKRVDPEKLVAAIHDMRALRAEIGSMTLEEILSARDEGRM